MYNFGRWYFEERFCETILNLGQWFRRRYRSSLSYHLSLRPMFCLFLSGRLRQVLLHLDGEERAGCFTLRVFLVIVVWLFLALPRVCLKFVIVVFPDRTRLLFVIILPRERITKTLIRPCLCRSQTK